MAGRRAERRAAARPVRHRRAHGLERDERRRPPQPALHDGAHVRPLLLVTSRSVDSGWRYDSEARLLLHTYARASVKRRSASLLPFNWLKQPSLLHVKNFRTKNFARI